MRIGLLAAFVAVLLGVAAWGCLASGPGDQSPAALAWLAVMILTELPAALCRMLGGTRLATWAVAVVPPLVLFEVLMGIQAERYRDVGGDLQGVEVMLMIYVIPPLVILTGSLVAIFSCLLIRRPAER